MYMPSIRELDTGRRGEGGGGGKEEVNGDSNMQWLSALQECEREAYYLYLLGCVFACTQSRRKTHTHTHTHTNLEYAMLVALMATGTRRLEA